MVDNHLSDVFLAASKDPAVGVKGSSRNVIKMLTSGHILKPQNLWEVDETLTDPATEQYFIQLLYTSLMLRSIQLGMEGLTMGSWEHNKFITDIEEIHSIFKCRCINQFKE